MYSSHMNLTCLEKSRWFFFASSSIFSAISVGNLIALETVSVKLLLFFIVLLFLFCFIIRNMLFYVNSPCFPCNYCV